jgi:tight adherence protein C
MTVAVVLVMAALFWPMSNSNNRGSRNVAQLAVSTTAVPDLLDLLTVAFDSGLDVEAALRLAAAYGPADIAEATSPLLGAVAVGRPVGEVLRRVCVDPGEPFGLVLAVLRDAHLEGADAQQTLDELGIDLRRISRSREQADARRLSVRLLFPLVLCMLPSFALLTIVPVAAGALSN